MHTLIAQSAGSAWSFGGSILTFAFPMLLFIGVAVALYLLYTKPEVVPGHRAPAAERPVSYTAVPGNPAATEVPGNPVPDDSNNPVPGDSKRANESENAETEGGE